MNKNLLILFLLVSLLATLVLSEVVKNDLSSQAPNKNSESSEVPDGYVHKRALSKLMFFGNYIKKKTRGG